MSFECVFRKGCERPSGEKATVASPASASGPADALSCSYSFDSDILAVGTSKGVMLLHAQINYRPASFMLTGAMAKKENVLTSAASCVRFQPTRVNADKKDWLLVACTDGTLSLWHLASAQLSYGERCFSENPADADTAATPTELYCADFSKNGQWWACSGKDGVVRIYDAARAHCMSKMIYNNVSDTYSAHSGRVQAVCWAPDDATVFSGGDTTVQRWDVRAGKSVRRIPDCLVAGPDGLDVNDRILVVANNRPQRGLQFFDLRNDLKPLFELQMPIAPATREWLSPEPTSLFAARFSPDRKFLAVGGGGGGPDFRVFDLKKTLHEGKFELPDDSKQSKKGDDDDKKVKRGSGSDEDDDDEKAGKNKTVVLSGQEVGSLQLEHSAFSVAWHPSAQAVATCGYGNFVAALGKMG